MPSSQTLLIITNDFLLQELFVLSLSPHYQIKTALSSQKGLELVTSFAGISLVLFDATVAETEGYAIFDTKPAIPVIIFSPHNDCELEEYVFNLGAADFIVAPIKPSVLLSRVRNQLLISKSYIPIQDLQENKYLFRAVIDTSSTSYLLYDNSTGFIDYVNPAFSKKFGNDLLTINDWWNKTFVDPEYREKIATEWMIKVDKVSRNSEMYFEPMEVYVTDKNGEQRWIIMEATPLHYEATETQLVTIYDISEIKKAEQAAEQLAKSKSEFLANMSHEIRTPINGVLGLAFVLSKKNLPSDEKMLVNKILTSGELLLGIINDILDISKIESDKLELENAEFDLTIVLDNLATLMTFSASEKRINLFIKQASHFLASVMLIGDSLRLQQVLVNLISNAIKFTEKGDVCVEIECLSKTNERISLKFLVQDTGIGISPEAQKIIFSPFSQADTSITRNYGGTGLGLTISRKLVELMGGEISLESEIGKGSIFSFTLHFDIVNKSTEEIVLPIKKTVDESSVRLLGFRLLIVDDNDINLEVAKRIFSGEGAIVITAQNGLQAVNWLKEHETGVDIILMDIQMPVMNGCEATYEIRKIPALAHIPIVALSAGVLKTQMDKVQCAGIQNFIMKPFNVDMAVNLIRKILGNHFIESATPNMTKSDAVLSGFEGVDVEGALENWREIRVYQTYLIQFLNDFEPDLNKIEMLDFDDLAEFAHKIKGAARALGLFDVGDAAEELEIIADENQYTDDAIKTFKKAMLITSNSIHLIVQYL